MLCSNSNSNSNSRSNSRSKSSAPERHQQRPPSLLLASREHHSHLAHKRSPSSPFERDFEPLYERPRVYLNAAQANLLQQQQQRDLSSTNKPIDFDEADGEFLRQLKEAARYLDDKLAERQRQQQQLAILNQAPGIGRKLLGSTGQQQQLAYSYQEPTYGVLEEERPIKSEVSARSRFANGWQALNENEPDEDEETNVVVLPPEHDNPRLIGSLSPDQAADYKLLTDRLQDQQQQQQKQKQQSITDDKYKLLTSLLLDHARANSLGSSFDSQKRDFNVAASAAKPTGDLIKTDNVEEQDELEKLDQTKREKPAVRYTTLLEDEEEDERNLGETKNAEGSYRAASYGKLVYDQANEKPSVGQSETGSDSAGCNSLYGCFKSNVCYYFPILHGLFDWFDNLFWGTDANTTTEDVSMGHLTEPVPIGQFKTESVNGTQGTNQNHTAYDEPHAKHNVSVSMALDKGEMNNDYMTTIDGNNRLENDGETDGQNRREIEADDLTQYNQQVQNNDKQLEHGMMNVKVTVDRKKINGTDDSGNSSSGDGNHEDGAVDDDNTFTGQFATNDQSTQTDAIDKRQPDSKSGGLKRDQGSQFVDSRNINNKPVEFDMGQMMPAAVVFGQHGFSSDRDDEQDQHQTANNYNMIKHSNLMVPIGASDILIGAAPGDANKEPGSLLGKYIYAPTQHYYLGSIMSPAGGGSSVRPNGHRHIVAQNGKHIQPGDEIYSSYGDIPMKAYAYHKDRNSIGDDSNDLYFLIMVGAFCVMAMAVVLAAGMFAYRIQSNRKSSQETDYPTYGVVGPNNMSAKCGAASFVGGYFIGSPNGSSKSGSIKHLPDLYGTPNGTGGSDSGLNSLDKSSNKKASSVSSLNEHHSVSSRAASSNFMTAASQDAARMYHYQHQKQQMIISDRNSAGRQTSASDLDSEDENDDGNYTVYECPGLASAHEMEIKNPLFNDDQSP